MSTLPPPETEIVPLTSTAPFGPSRWRRPKSETSTWPVAPIVSESNGVTSRSSPAKLGPPPPVNVIRPLLMKLLGLMSNT